MRPVRTRSHRIWVLRCNNVISLPVTTPVYCEIITATKIKRTEDGSLKIKKSIYLIFFLYDFQRDSYTTTRFLNPRTPVLLSKQFYNSTRKNHTRPVYKIKKKIGIKNSCRFPNKHLLIYISQGYSVSQQLFKTLILILYNKTGISAKWILVLCLSRDRYLFVDLIAIQNEECAVYKLHQICKHENLHYNSKNNSISTERKTKNKNNNDQIIKQLSEFNAWKIILATRIKYQSDTRISR